MRLKAGVLYTVWVTFRKGGIQLGTLPEKNYRKDKRNGKLVHDRRFKELDFYSIVNERLRGI